MTLIEKLTTVSKFFEDDISKEIFDAVVKRYYDSSDDSIESLLYDYYKSSRILALEEYGYEFDYVVCGAGNFGKKTIKALKHAGYNIRCVLDNDEEKSGKSIQDIPIYSFANFVTNKELYENTIVILDNQRLRKSFFNELIELGYPQSRIYQTTDDIVRSAFGNIYFDLPELRLTEHEIFIDAGSFDGSSTTDFINVVNGNYDKIYAFEPMTDGFILTKNALDNISNVEICKAALCNQVGEGNFTKSYEGLMGSSIGNKGTYAETVRLETIDHYLSGKKCTFIKMDIEGAELDALRGDCPKTRT